MIFFILRINNVNGKYIFIYAGQRNGTVTKRDFDGRVKRNNNKKTI